VFRVFGVAQRVACSYIVGLVLFFGSKIMKLARFCSKIWQILPSLPLTATNPATNPEL
jgi:hypothetical protein